jgi:NAD(P)-dependent dehydrogenase (short-subunit alcohol dehydrogenase family)
VHETAVGAFEEQLRLNLLSAYAVTAAALPHLIAAGGGSIVCVSSRAALRPFSGAAGYITAKAALLAFVSALAVEYRDDGIRANAVIPSVIDTPANRANEPGADYRRWVSPEQIAATISFLCGDDSAATSGAHIPVYGRA